MVKDPEHNQTIRVRDLAYRTLKRDMTTEGYRAIAFSFKDYTIAEFKKLRDFQTEETIDELKKN